MSRCAAAVAVAAAEEEEDDAVADAGLPGAAEDDDADEVKASKGGVDGTADASDGDADEDDGEADGWRECGGGASADSVALPLPCCSSIGMHESALSTAAPARADASISAVSPSVLRSASDERAPSSRPTISAHAHADSAIHWLAGTGADDAEDWSLGVTDDDDDDDIDDDDDDVEDGVDDILL